jgi:hypothetical protein
MSKVQFVLFFFFPSPNRKRFANISQLQFWQLVEEIDAEEGVGGAGQELAPSSYRLRSVLRHGRVSGFRI